MFIFCLGKSGFVLGVDVLCSNLDDVCDVMVMLVVRWIYFLFNDVLFLL